MCTNHWQAEKDAGRLEQYAARPLGAITACPHTDRKHAAKGMCKSCYTVAWTKAHPESNTAREWHKRNPEKFKEHKRKAHLKKYGLQLECYTRMWREQGGKCGNSGCTFTAELSMPDLRKGLGVDHDHATGKVRGLLCAHCNAGLGHLNDDATRLHGLIQYLEKHK